MLRHRPSGVAVLSPTESGDSDITEPRSPRSPESLGAAEECASARMPPWASDPAPAPPAPRRLAAQPAPTRRPNTHAHRRITEFFNHKMKPQNGVKRDQTIDDKKKCFPKNGVTHELEKYISYLSQTLSPKVLKDVGKQAEVAARKPINPVANGSLDTSKATDLTVTSSSMNNNGIVDSSKSKINHDKIHSTNMNGFLEVFKEAITKEKKQTGPVVNGTIDSKKSVKQMKTSDPSAKAHAHANNQSNKNKRSGNNFKRKVPIPASREVSGVRIAPATPITHDKEKVLKLDTTKLYEAVSSTTKLIRQLDIRMNGVTCGSNNLNLNPIISKPAPLKKETPKKSPIKRTNRQSSACIANSKNLTWSKANNLKQLQHQQQNCMNLSQSVHTNTNSPAKTNSSEAIAAPKPMSIPNGVRQVSMTVNGSLGNLNVPVPNLHNCHQINIPQPCNGTVPPNNLASFVAVPQNVMLTTLRIPQNGLSQTLGQQNNMTNMTAFNRTNVNVPSPTKLNGQFVFPLISQNLNGTVVQIPNLMAKMPNFVLPQTPQLATQRQDHLQNQPATQILVNGTFLKLASTMTTPYPPVNKQAPPTNQNMPGINKNVPGMQTVNMPDSKSLGYTVNFSHPMLMPQPGFIVTSVPNMNVKETWSYSHTDISSAAHTSCSNPVVQHPLVTNFTSQAMHTSSIPIAPVKPPDNPIQGTEPPSSTVKEPEMSEVSNPKCDIPWLSKTVNNNIVPFESNIFNARPFAQVSSLSEKLEELAAEKMKEKKSEIKDKETMEPTIELKKVEEVARREGTIFTQITVLKDVSSNVHNTVIEATFNGATTESESGIGTDKSIDSPSDSQTSKECDDDSSLSLSISLSSVEVQSQKSPILKQPKTLRFPPKSLTDSSDTRTSSTDTVSLCLWENCKREFDSDPDLLEHLQSAHVETQAGKENYVCLWQQCKVRGKPSCSRLWLERHALSHGGSKPFKCIVDGCDRRFSTQILLERHVNNHFNEASPNASGNKKTAESGAKLIRRNGKKLRYRRQPWSARMFDFFDAGMMEGLAHRLSRCTAWRLGGGCPLREPKGFHTLTLHAALSATRYNATEKRREALVTYYPPHVLDDEWVPEKEVKRIKRVEIAQLPSHTKVLLYEQFCASYKLAPPPAPIKRPATPPRVMPNRNCASSRVLNNLIAKQRRPERECNATNRPQLCREEDSRVEVSGAKKRKLGRRHGGNAFWPCGR